MSKGGGSSSGGSSYNVSSNTVPDWVTNASQSALQTAQGIASTPYESLYQAAGGQLTADLSPQQYQGISEIQQMQGMTNPGYQASEDVYSSLLGQATPITTSELNSLTNSLYGNYLGNVYSPAASGYGAAYQNTGNLLGGALQYSGNQYGNAQNYSTGQYGQAMAGTQNDLLSALGNSSGLLSGFTQYAAPATAAQVGSNVTQLMSPYVNLVTNPTETLMQQQLAQNLQSNAQQASNVGAYGGTRMGVQNAVAQAQEPVLAGQYLGNLLNQGYQANLTPAYNLASQASQQGYGAASTLAGQGLTAAQQLATQGYNSAAALSAQQQAAAQALAQQQYGSAGTEAQQGYNTAQALASLLSGGYGNAATAGQSTANTNLQTGLTAAQQLPQEYQAQATETATEAGLLQQAGQTLQNQQNSLIQDALTNYMWQNYYPQQQLDTETSTLASLPYSTTTTSYGTGASQASATPSVASDVGAAASIAAMVYAI